MNWYLKAMRRYFEWRGRSARAEFWYFTLFYLIISFLSGVVDYLLGYTDVDQLTPVNTLVILVHIIPTITVSIRRFHDRDQSGWRTLGLIVPIANLVLLADLARRGTDGPNRFGDDPLDPIADPHVHSRLLQAGAPRSVPVVNPRRPTFTSHNAAVPSSSNSLIEEIERLDQLRRNGVISEQEFDRLKANTMKRADA
ncbi:Uncharacterized membrane protein YhaH, DUF805 family [Faunimonas pinastri]|uniref:Uncharacterized membrane protein YhaH, DUF805 family n=1 Tax=Faunimonas pinastri TaxID=1855383 RepID=A0A1H9N0X1_9HYPH|nr:DUF805 domain-containing protein [Faunimonas pinastri]SER28993.1 Uncharacterized membrane protein YhaH, DUF805 family [Faunimonas pinastri]